MDADRKRDERNPVLLVSPLEKEIAGTCWLPFFSGNEGKASLHATEPGCIPTQTGDDAS